MLQLCRHGACALNPTWSPTHKSTLRAWNSGTGGCADARCTCIPQSPNFHSIACTRARGAACHCALQTARTVSGRTPRTRCASGVDVQQWRRRSCHCAARSQRWTACAAAKAAATTAGAAGATTVATRTRAAAARGRPRRAPRARRLRATRPSVRSSDERSRCDCFLYASLTLARHGQGSSRVER